jgi:enamine deaminase RidA (YjgF/YER057c/UK114 family)
MQLKSCFVEIALTMSIQRNGTTRRYSDSVIHNGTIYLVEVPGNLEAGITAQCENVLASIERQLSQLGSDKSRLLLVTIYLADMADYAALNEVWENWLPQGCAPVRACLQAKLSAPGYLVEMVVTAALAAERA